MSIIDAVGSLICQIAVILICMTINLIAMKNDMYLRNYGLEESDYSTLFEMVRLAIKGF